MATNFDLAPPPVTFGGKTAVPIDIAAIDAHLTFDGATQSAHGEATVTFVVGPDAGCPIFDLRQAITSASLDGSPIGLAQILTRDLGGGAGAEVRVLDVAMAAGSSHTLHLAYDLGLPAAPMGGSYPPGLAWSAGPRLRFNFGFTDLFPGRYLESFVPANLIWDQYALTIELELTGTTVAHQPITNGTVTSLGANHWRVVFPDRFTAFSTLLELRPSDTLASASSIVTLPVSGQVVTIEAWKLSSNTALNLATVLSNLSSFLVDNENTAGRYMHGNRFVAFIIQGGMEYEGGCTTGTGALRHETYHSWWGRGVKPASQADGWWDEGWNTYRDSGGTGTDPFNFAESPVTLSPRNGYSRVTPTTAYPEGERFFEGVAALSSPASLNGWMREFYLAHGQRPVTTLDLECHLVSRSGQADLVDAFHRWVYGFADPSAAPNLWLRDDPGHTGTEQWSGRFWDSPDLWIRNQNDGGLTHQPPMAGRDNWFHARIRNQGTGTARHFVVTFQVKQFAGVQFEWPGDFLPAIAATGGFDLGPGQTRIVKARWPAALVPAAGTHACWLAAVLTRFDRPASGAHVWEHGNLAQKNLTIVRLKRGMSVLLPFVTIGRRAAEARTFELLRPDALLTLDVAIVPKALRPPVPAPEDIADGLEHRRLVRPRREGLLTGDDNTELVARGFELTKSQLFPAGPKTRLTVTLPAGQAQFGLLLKHSDLNAAVRTATFDLVQRDGQGRIVGGLAVEVTMEK